MCWRYMQLSIQKIMSYTISISIAGSDISMSPVRQTLSCPIYTCMCEPLRTPHTFWVQAPKMLVLCSCMQQCMDACVIHHVASYSTCNLHGDCAPCLLAGMHIVAMAAGYIDPLPAELVVALRKQVLVAVTSNWQVMCFDHNLRLLWETTILVCQSASQCMTSCCCTSKDTLLPPH